MKQLNECKIFSGWLTTTDKELLCFFFLIWQGGKIKINFRGVRPHRKFKASDLRKESTIFANKVFMGHFILQCDGVPQQEDMQYCSKLDNSALSDTFLKQ